MFRDEVITEFVRGKDVLDCGAVDHGFLRQKMAKGEWLHHAIVSSARTCVAVDILGENVRAARSVTSSAWVVANVEALPFTGAFDAVVAAEVIEHVYNVGAFLDSIWRSLRSGGALILTTPNAYSLSKALYAAVLNREVCHPEHTCYFSPQTLRYVLITHGFHIVKTMMLPRPSQYAALTRVYQGISKWRPLLSEKLLIIAGREESQNKYGAKW